MSINKAYTYKIGPVGSSNDENYQVNQSSPSWMLTFVGWKYRDTYRLNKIKTSQSESANVNVSDQNTLKETVQPLIVINDCVNASVTNNKNSFTPNFEATLVQTDVNYLTAVAPGDFVLVNMLNWDSDIDRVYKKAQNLTGINDFNDGFKGIFKVQSVRRTVSVIDEEKGTKAVFFKITGFAFTEFNNMIYFDPSVNLQQNDYAVFASRISSTWTNLISANKSASIQDLIRTLIGSFIGTSSLKKLNQTTVNTANGSTTINGSFNDNYYIPGAIFSLLGFENEHGTSAKDLYNYIFGLQTYNNTSSSQEPREGLNPSINYDATQEANFYYTNTSLAGKAVLLPEYWNQNKTWDILNQYMNKPLNEAYTCFKVDPVDGTVMPTMVLRQIPFTNEDFFEKNPNLSGTPVTPFMTLPRWKVSSNLLISQEIGRDDALRVNYVQVFSKILQGGNLGVDYTQETSRINYRLDENDIQRSGLRPIVTSNTFDVFDDTEKQVYHSPIWAAIYGDAVIGQHLKLNGTFVFAGIVQPICVGDNLEFEDVVYHIEQISHKCYYSQEGRRLFRTIVSVSSGMSIQSGIQNSTLYPEMDNSNAYSERNWDYNRSKILPGVSESQKTIVRGTNPDISQKAMNANDRFPQPKNTYELTPNKDDDSSGKSGGQ